MIRLNELEVDRRTRTCSFCTTSLTEYVCPNCFERFSLPNGLIGHLITEHWWGRDFAHAYTYSCETASIFPTLRAA